ncbi:hypothetical protein MMC11_009062 [Xylographa trunciseda]|nr:hypothetical protein [Xylographa trunciseda]
MSKGQVASFSYYNDTGSGSVVYPQVLDTSGSVLWDGRKQSGFKWELSINESVTVHLVDDAGISDDTICSAGFNVVYGSDRHDLSDQFTTVPLSSGGVASFTFFGPADNGSIQYNGITSFSELKKRHDDAKIHDKVAPAPAPGPATTSAPGGWAVKEETIAH